MLTRVYRSIIKVEEQMLYELSSGKLTIGEMHLLESMEITLPSVTAMAKRLERKGYVRRDRSSVDARRVHVALTEAGLRAEIAHRYFHRKMVRELTAELDAQEKAAILTGLEKMNGFIRRQIAGAAGKEA